MSSFAQGFALGGDLASQAQKIQLAEEAAAREKERFGWERDREQLEKQGRQAAIETYGKVGTQDYSQAIQQQGGAGSQQAQMISDQADGMGISPELQAEGYALLCVAYPRSDLKIETGKEDEVYTRQFKQA
jgi:hypothetical protein